MYWSPLRRPDPEPRRTGHEMKGIGGPEKVSLDSAPALKRDAVDADKDYRKPGRSPRR